MTENTLNKLIEQYTSTLRDEIRTFRQEGFQRFIESRLMEPLMFDVLFIRGLGGSQTTKFDSAIESGKQFYFAGSFFEKKENIRIAKKHGMYSLKDRIENNIIGEIKEHTLVSKIEIFETKDYGIFIPMQGQPKERAIKNAKGLEEHLKPSGGNIMPIIVNKDMKVIDGNTRLEACKTLGLPVKYQIIKNENDIEMMKMMNASNKPWTQYNFIEFYAEAYEDINFKALKKFILKNNLSIGIYAPLHMELTATNIKDGNIGRIDYVKLQEKVDKLYGLLEAIGPFMTSKLQASRALAELLNYGAIESYDIFFKRISQNITKAMKDMSMNKINHKDELLMILQKSFNSGKKNKKRIYDDLA